MQVLKMTEAFVRCTNCMNLPSARLKNGSSPLLDPWCPPRGWAGTTRTGRRTVFVLALNPGAPMDGERDLWSKWGMTAGKSSSAATQKLLTHCTSNYMAPSRGRDTVFHRKSVGLARAALWLFGAQDFDDPSWIDQCWFTDIYKCSTKSERGPNIPAGALAACRQHLDAELEMFSPRVILTLGSRAMRAMQGAPTQIPTVAFRFPSGGGLAALSSPALNAQFKAIADIAERPWTPELEGEFDSYRKKLQASLFGGSSDTIVATRAEAALNQRV